MSERNDPDPDGSSEGEGIGAWRQGDCALGEHWFAYRIDPRNPTTMAAAAAATAGADLAEVNVAGFVIVTQTCDIVRSDPGSPFVEVCPLVEVSEPDYREVERRTRPRYAIVPGVAGARLVADLDRTMTVERNVVAGWTRVAGCATDAEARAFGQALARKRARTAFPDDFVELTRVLRRRIAGKHNRQSEEGAALQALCEIRVMAWPAWHASDVKLTFWFIARNRALAGSLEQWVEKWLGLIVRAGRFTAVDGQAVSLDDMTAAEYVDSDLLDFGWLSG